MQAARAEEGVLTISGSGDIAVDVGRRLDVHISGSGDVVYRGNPERNVRIDGSGSVERR